MGSFAELLEQLNARYEADLQRARDESEAVKATPSKAPEMKFSHILSKGTRWNEMPVVARHSSVPRQKLPLSKNLFTCGDIDGILSRIYLRLSSWWMNLVEPQRSGYVYNIVESKPFRAVTCLVIVINSISIALMTDWSIAHGPAGMPWAYIAVDLACLVAYSIELILCLWVHRLYFFVNDSAGWNWLHFVLVLWSLGEVTIMADDEAGTGSTLYMRMLRFCRVTKAFRIFRLMSSFHELAAMLRSFASCMWAMVWSFILLYLLLFLGALIFAQGVGEGLVLGLFEDEDVKDVKAHFGSVSQTMLSLYMSVTGGNDWIVYFDIVQKTGFVYAWLFLLFTFTFTIALVNILTALFVEKAVEGAKPEREYRILHERQKLAQKAEELRELFFSMDLDASGKISWEEFVTSIVDDNILAFMHTLGLEVTDAELLWKLVAGQGGELEIADFVDTCMAVCGQASTLDIQKQLLAIQRVDATLKQWEEHYWPRLLAAPAAKLQL